MSSADFDDLANIDARLGNYFWLGFIITGLSPDKKRPAWHGAQRKAHGSRILSALRVLGCVVNCHEIGALVADPRFGAASCSANLVHLVR